MEPTSGVEPLTRCLQNSRSDQLSYVGSSERTLLHFALAQSLKLNLKLRSSSKFYEQSFARKI